ncbi:ISL3 family transposase [Acidisoma silvae]|uniref:ISL3 family transposase n=1 Tax=Acidisoma silvae TaxID=2802396 RepID=A0A963YW43_9PROT|nr:ISL3 family transposase [Acidisoma silvae]MCB8878051.1 ISL3 family transposase [Acidisoma silvae]
MISNPDSLVIEVKPKAISACCPDCGYSWQQVHSRYHRRLADLPWQGRPCTLLVSARRFRCPERACARRTFAEPLDGSAIHRGRHTSRLVDLQRYIAFALGGSAGARMAERISCPVSADTLGRRILDTGVDPEKRACPRVLGVDDWAWRRGRRYGTILVDLEQNKVIDLLPDRQSETLACWLRDHPGVEIVARDRAGAYADGIRQGAPSAIQVSDRWHLLRNLSDAFLAVIDRHSAVAKRIAAELYRRPQPKATLRHGARRVGRPRTLSQPAVAAAVIRRGEIFEDVKALKDSGISHQEIGRRLGMERKRVRRWLQRGHAPNWTHAQRSSIVDDHAEYLHRRMAEGCRNVSQLWRELVTFGFEGKRSVVYQWLEKPRSLENEYDDTSRAPVPLGRRLARLLLTSPTRQSITEREFIARLLSVEPALAKASRWVKAMDLLLRKNAVLVLDHFSALPHKACRLSG